MLHVRTGRGLLESGPGGMPGGRYPRTAVRAPMPRPRPPLCGLQYARYAHGYATRRMALIRRMGGGSRLSSTSLSARRPCGRGRSRHAPRSTVTVWRRQWRGQPRTAARGAGGICPGIMTLCYVSTMALRFRSEVRFAARPSWSRGVHSGVHTSKMRTSGRTREVELAPRNCRVRRRRGGCLR